VQPRERLLPSLAIRCNRECLEMSMAWSDGSNRGPDDRLAREIHGRHVIAMLTEGNPVLVRDPKVSPSTPLRRPVDLDLHTSYASRSLVG